MSHVRESVGTSKHGSTNALPGSGSSSMSLSLIAWKPRIDEPSNPRPSVNVSSSSSFKGIEKCCQVPGRSVNRTSTTCTPASFARRITSAGDVPVAAFAPVATVGSIVAVIEWGLLPGSVRRFASGGPYGKVEALRMTVKKSVHELQEKPAEWPFTVWKCANCPFKLCSKCATTPPRSATARRQKTPQTAREYASPAIRGRSTRSSCAVARSRSESARAPRPVPRQPGPRGRRPSVAPRVSTLPCACRIRCWPWATTLPAFVRPASPGYIPLAMTCHACGAQLSSTARFCHKCGATVATAGASGWRAGLPWGVAGAALGALVAVVLMRGTGRKEPETLAGPVGIRAPDISQLSPEERATRLFNRVMTLAENGKTDSVQFFLPMALGAYGQLPSLDADARYHVGHLQLLGGDVPGALAQADTIQRAVPTHLFASVLRARAYVEQ